MIDLADALHRVAPDEPPAPDLEQLRRRAARQRSTRTGLRFGAVLAAAALVVLGSVVVLRDRSDHSDTATQPSTLTPAAYVDAAAQALEGVSGVRPKAAAVYPSTSRNAALEAINAGSMAPSEGSVQVVTVEFRGDFTLNGASRPSGADAPTAKQYFVLIDTTTGQVLDAGGNNSPLDVSSRLGTPTWVPDTDVPSGSGRIDLSAAVDGPVVHYVNFASDTPDLLEVRGDLELDGACLRLGGQIPIIWPAGTVWDASNRTVISATGQAMPVGTEVVGNGGFVEIGTLSPEYGEPAIGALTSCVDSETDLVAVINNSDDSIAPASG